MALFLQLVARDTELRECQELATRRIGELQGLCSRKIAAARQQGTNSELSAGKDMLALKKQLDEAERKCARLAQRDLATSKQLKGCRAELDSANSELEALVREPQVGVAGGGDGSGGLAIAALFKTIVEQEAHDQESKAFEKKWPALVAQQRQFMRSMADECEAALAEARHASMAGQGMWRGLAQHNAGHSTAEHGLA